MKVCQRKTVRISDNVESRGQMSAQPLKGDTVTVSQSRMGRLSLNPPSGKYEDFSVLTGRHGGVFVLRNMRRVIMDISRYQGNTYQPTYYPTASVSGGS